MRLRVVLLAFALACAACDFINTPTKTANGQLYQSGDAKYDGYFAQVHQEQVAAASWPDDAKAARRPVIVALDLRPGASNATILSAVKEKKANAALGKAVDETAAAERDRGQKLHAAEDRLEELLKRGEDLKKTAVEDRRNMGVDRADEKKVAKRDEIKHEIAAAVDAVDGMLTDARRSGREADELGRRLRGAFRGTNEDEAPPPREEKKDDKPEKKDDKPEKKDDKKKPEPVARKPAARKPPAEPAGEPAEKPAPKPKPPAKPPDEVFNP